MAVAVCLISWQLYSPTVINSNRENEVVSHQVLGFTILAYCYLAFFCLFWPILAIYCGWKKSCTTLDGWNPINNGIYHLSTGAGFRIHPLYVWRCLESRPGLDCFCSSSPVAKASPCCSIPASGEVRGGIGCQLEMEHPMYKRCAMMYTDVSWYDMT